MPGSSIRLPSHYLYMFAKRLFRKCSVRRSGEHTVQSKWPAPRETRMFGAWL